ncbi:MAG TPA: uridylate kinase [Methanocorpusculum sp.]|nr:uridylate kinase [Methanocorpusculum sp.]
MKRTKEGLVIKLGGSLADVAGDVLSVIATSPLPALIVPGGGAFADAVRKKNLDDDSAHWQAISAMNHYGVYLATFGFPLTETPDIPQRGIQILLPEKILRQTDPLPHSWDVTSDSIALWIAQNADAPLLLIKSRDGDPADPEYIDPYFEILNKNGKIAFSFVNGRDTAKLKAIFQ